MKKLLNSSSSFQCSYVGTQKLNALCQNESYFSEINRSNLLLTQERLYLRSHAEALERAEISTQECSIHYSHAIAWEQDFALERIFPRIFWAVLIFFILLSNACSLNFIKKRLSPPHPVKNGILFQYEAPSARIVTLAGEFPDNQWGGTAGSSHTYDSTIDKMYDDGTHGDLVADDGIWSLVKIIEPGRYQYKFVVDRNTWVTDPNGLETTDDGYGGKNSVLIVK